MNRVIMQNMSLRKIFSMTLLLGSTLLLAACQTSSPTATLDLFVSGKLTPYHTATTTPTVTPTPVNAPTATLLPTITPTTFFYTVKGSETLWTIAAKNGVSLADILAANPKIDPYILSAGTQVVVPPPSAASGTPTAPSATAVPMLLKDPVCSPSLTGGLYCFALVENNQDYPVQNLTAQFTLTDPVSGEQLQQVGSLPLDQLKSQTSLPLFAYFPPPVFASPKVNLTLLTALPVSSTSTSVLEVTLKEAQIQIATDGYSATVQANLTLQKADAKANHYWVAAVAYDKQGNVVGVRQYEKGTDLSSGQSAAFTLYVYSISDQIDHVDLFGEAKQLEQ